MNKKITFTLIGIFIITSFLLPSISAIGISPGSTTINFEPNKEKEIQFKILNNEKKDMKVVFNVEGDLAQYITLHNILVDLKATEESKTSFYTVKLPPELEKPGTNIAKIIALELPPDATEEGNYIGSRVGVISRLEVLVPYPGKYAEVELRISEANPGQPVTFIVKVLNYGTEDITDAQATIDILGPTNEKIAALTTNAKPVKAKQIEELTAQWIPEYPGFYNAALRLRYDEKITNTAKVFYIGNLMIDLLNVEVKNFKLGGVAKFDLLVENKWNDIVKNVYAEIFMRDQQESEVGNFKSVSTNLPPLAQETLVAYWDTENIESGQYDATITINYEDGKKTEKQFKVDVSLENIRLSPLGATAQVINARNTLKGSLIALLVAVLIIINLAWFIYFKRKLKNK